MIEKLNEDLYRIPVPLPGNPLRELNSYLIRGQRDLLIDAGFNLDVCEQSMLKAFDELRVNPKNLDLAFTHLHPDHVGLAARLVRTETTVWCGQIPYETLGLNKADEGWKERFSRLKGLGIEEIGNSWDLLKQPEFNLEWKNKLSNFKVLKEGDILKVGAYTLRCLETPGHFPGHICFYEPFKKYLFAGDHILDRISPNVACYNLDDSSSLDQYLTNLNRLKALEVEKVFPGHRNIFADCNRRIEELKEHHRERLSEVRAIVSKKPQTAAEIARQMKWKLSYSSWDDFPLTQKFFALGETLAHLNYLKQKNFLKIEKINSLYYFAKNEDKVHGCEK